MLRSELRVTSYLSCLGLLSLLSSLGYLGSLSSLTLQVSSSPRHPFTPSRCLSFSDSLFRNTNSAIRNPHSAIVNSILWNSPICQMEIHLQLPACPLPVIAAWLPLPPYPLSRRRGIITNTNDISSVSLRGAERRSNPKQRRDCRALRARNDCNDNYFVCINTNARNYFACRARLQPCLMQPSRVAPQNI
jgi:hypothetical protein